MGIGDFAQSPIPLLSFQFKTPYSSELGGCDFKKKFPESA